MAERSFYFTYKFRLNAYGSIKLKMCSHFIEENKEWVTSSHSESDSSIKEVMVM